MNKASRLAATINPQVNPFQIRASFFHCTPVSERRRRTHWDSESFFRSPPKKSSEYHKRLKKQTLLRNVSGFTELLFQSWQYDRDDSDRGSSWFRSSFGSDEYVTKGKSNNRSSRASRRFDFCDDDDEFETFFRSPFGGNRDSHWSFTIDFDSRFSNSSSYSSKFRRNASTGWKYQYDYDGEEEEYYDESSSHHHHQKPMMGLASDRLALGLSASGPLKVEDVKNAYRACALKWHPDRHQGSSKVVAEEKFKVCSAAYQSLCDNLKAA